VETIKEQKDILFLAATHGNEAFTIPILQKLQQEFPDRFDWLVANELAMERGVRFVEIDLNRSAPGDRNSTQYEMWRANDLLAIAQQYRFVIDLHGTLSNSGIFVLMSNPTPANIALAVSLPVSNIVIGADTRSRDCGPLMQFVNCGVVIECGPKHSEAIHEELEKILREIIVKSISLDPSRKQEWFRVYGRIPLLHQRMMDRVWFEPMKSTDDWESSLFESLQDFRLNTIKGKDEVEEAFYPLFVGQYPDTVCYKMQKVNFWDLFAH
jgi:hypothetical protein